jgi:HEPN domain-containing protein
MESVFMRAHEHWHIIALEDLDSAKHLFVRSFMTTLFHVQQCAEKALKSYVVLKKGSVKKTHDLVQLIDICMEIDNSFEVLRSLAAEITPYETAGRYPDNSFKKLSQEEIQELINQSEYIFNFVTHRMDISQSK